MIFDVEHYDCLIIEDDPATLHLLITYFEKNGLTCKSVICGIRGLEALERGLPKVILLDLTLPNLHWYEVVLEIRAKNSSKNIPLFLFGETKCADMNAKIKNMGVTGVIPKPFCLKDFDILRKYASKPLIDNITLWNFEDNE
ncbi:hypothetical protein LCGC14_1625050 [marine sediment metagenome]|uniref:Response regulatory domain-containing protein n=1 Tax=marine sediment metagenome TaxID=412755 RepID=A0A0F9L3Z1_9ZZZZ